MIYTITFNPSLDYIMHVSDFKEGKTNRSSSETIYPGGKGFNVSIILQRLNFENCALGFIAGFTGEDIEKGLKERNIHTNLRKLKTGLSRINVKIKGKVETEINGNGPDILPEDIDWLKDQLTILGQNDVLILAGSILSSLSKDIYYQMMSVTRKNNVKVVVDATGDLLRKILPLQPFLIKPNKDELEELFNVEINDEKTLIHYAKELQKMGASNVLVSLGKDGALLVTDTNECFKADAPIGKVMNTVGSGDSMVAGFVAGYLKKHDYKEALHLGSACGSATAFSLDLAKASLIEEIYQSINIEKLA